jgi:phospholipid/cholesterol/gamma-HCH transport system substrate-binding protein
MIKPTDRKHYLVSGVFISILLFIVMVTVFMLNKENPLFSSMITIKTQVKSAQNLKDGAGVQLKGIKVGSVKSIDFKDHENLEISLTVNQKYQEWIKADSEIRFQTQGVLGDKFLEITGGTAEAKVILDGESLTTIEGSQFEHIITKSEDLMVVAGSILTKFDKILTKVEDNRLDKILINLEQLSNNTNQVMSKLNDKNLNQSITNLKNSSDSLSRITNRIEDGPGTLHALIYDQGLHEDLRTLVGGANRNKVLKFFIRESIKKNDN